MTGKILAACIILAALIAGGSIYYLQVYAYYTTVSVHGSEDVMLTAQASGQPSGGAGGHMPNASVLATAVERWAS